MLKTITIISTLLLVAGCAQTPQHWNRGHGEEYKFYPYTPGSSHKIAEEGRACEIKMLGIQADITNYSFIKGKTAYLEEDCDAPKFIRAMKLKGIDIAIKEGSRRERSPIRYFKSYTQEV